MRRLALCAVVVCCSCLDTTVPPTPGSGTITGRLLVAAAGTPTGVPAANAHVTLVESGLDVATGDDGRFEISPVLTTRGTLRFSSGALVRTMTLEALRAGPGKTTVLGDVALSVNASVQGEVLLADDPAADGTLVFIEGETGTTFTNRTGQFLLRDLPVGPVTLAVFRRGYRPVQLPLELRSGERFVVDRLVLQPDPGAVTRVTGTATLADANDSSGIAVSRGTDNDATTAGDGTYAITLEPGVFSFSFTHREHRTVTLTNRLIASGDVALPPVQLVLGPSTAPPPTPPLPIYDGGTEPDDAGVTDAGVTDAGIDAGLPDAGEDDAGLPDAGVDAGLPDAGFDAGLPDAGEPDAGADAGEPDAGTDAGPDLFPIAVIGPIPTVVLADAGALQLNGSGSSGTPVLVNYRWDVDAGSARLKDGGVVTLSANNSAFAIAPTVTLPVAPAVVTLQLQVTDAIGRVSAPAQSGFVVGDLPLAFIDAGTQPLNIYEGHTVTLDGSGSRDTVGSGLISRRWAVSPNAPISGAAISGGTQYRFTVGPVSFNQQILISHWVTNGLGLESLERTQAFTVLTGTLPSAPWSVVTAGTFTVDGGTVVPLIAKLDGGTQGAAYADVSNYTWEWVALTDAGAPPQWAITDATRFDSSFIPPVVEGSPVRYDFLVSATTKPPLASGTSSATLTVVAYDRVRPQLFDTSLASGAGSAMGLRLTFSEDMSTANDTNLDVVRTSNNTSAVTRRLWRGEQFLMVTRPPPSGVDVWELRVTQSTGYLRDVVGNDLLPFDGTSNPQYRATFIPELRWTPVVELATAQQSVSPQPVLLPRSTATLGRHDATLLARVGATLVTAETGTLGTCSAPPCALAPQTFATGASTGDNPGLPLLMHRGAPHYQPVAGEVWAPDGGAWPTAPGLVFSDGLDAGAFFISGSTLKLTRFDGGAWDVTNAETAYTGSVNFPIDGTTVVTSAAATPTATCVTLVTGNRIVPLTKGAAGFGIPLTNNPAANSLLVTKSRVTATGSRCDFAHLEPDGDLVFVDKAAGDHGGTSNFRTLRSGVSDFDAVDDLWGTYLWLASIETGQLRLNALIVGSPMTTFPALGPDGGTSLNIDPACEASKPQLSRIEQALYVTWQEQCAGQPYKVYVRGLF